MASTRKETLDRISFCKRSLRFWLVTYLPSVPEKGLVLARKAMLTVGASMVNSGNTRGFSKDVMVLADVEFAHSGNGHDVAGHGILQVEAVQASETEDARNTKLFFRSVTVNPSSAISFSFETTASDTANRHRTKVIVMVEGRHLQSRGQIVVLTTGGCTLFRITSNNGFRSVDS